MKIEFLFIKSDIQSDSEIKSSTISELTMIIAPVTLFISFSAIKNNFPPLVLKLKFVVVLESLSETIGLPKFSEHFLSAS